EEEVEESSTHQYYWLRSGVAGIAPLLGICCLALIGLLIAATIVLALIPVYLPKRHGASSTTPIFLTATVNQTAGPNGALPSSNFANIARAIERARGLPAGSVVVQQAVVNSNGNGRKKRNQFALTRVKRQSTTTIILEVVFNLLLCPFCGGGGFLASLINLDFALAIIGRDGLLYYLLFTISQRSTTAPSGFAVAGEGASSATSPTVTPTPSVGGGSGATMSTTPNVNG
ncbi:unnamed protein product, partial [Didymodactylos carnosus]